MTTPDEIYAEMARHKATINAGLTLKTLEAHKGFQELILDGYLNKEALRLVRSLGRPGISSQEREEAQRRLDAIGVFANYLSCVRDEAEIARVSLLETEKIFEEVHAERL